MALDLTGGHTLPEPKALLKVCFGAFLKYIDDSFASGRIELGRSCT